MLKHKRLTAIALLFSVVLCMNLLRSEAWNYDSKCMRLKINKASTWVSIAQVKLAISQIDIKDGRLTGFYDMQVPMFSENDEAGYINLSYSGPIADIRNNGGCMEGESIRWDNKSVRRKVNLEIYPDESDKDRGNVIFKIDTGERILTFETTYELESVSS